MLNLVQTEFLKLRRKKMIWFMLLAAFIMPFFSFVYYNYFEASGIDPVAFYKLAAFGYTPFIILPFVLGVFCVVLMHDENRYDMLKQLWIVPVSKMGYFFSKFIVVLIYSIVFMLISAVATVLFSVLPGFVDFEWQSVGFLAERCLEIGVLTLLLFMPILALPLQKGLYFPVCMTRFMYFSAFLSRQSVCTCILCPAFPLSLQEAEIFRDLLSHRISMSRWRCSVSLFGMRCLCYLLLFRFARESEVI